MNRFVELLLSRLPARRQARARRSRAAQWQRSRADGLRPAQVPVRRGPGRYHRRGMATGLPRPAGRLGTQGSAHQARHTRQGDKGHGRQSVAAAAPAVLGGLRAVGTPDATTAGEESWSSGPTGPQRVLPGRDGVPGYEFEGRRTAQRPPPPSPPRRPPRSPRARRAASGTPRPSASRYPPGTTSSHPASSSTPRPRPPAAQTTSARTPAALPPTSAHGPNGAGLLRSFLPEPARRSWFAEFRAALHFRGAGLRVIVPILAMIVFGVVVAVIAGANNSHEGPAPPPAALGFPPATLAGNDFTAAANGRGISQTLSRVASDGAEIVAVGSQQGARIARAQFFVSTDGGRTWSMGRGAQPRRRAAAARVRGPVRGGRAGGLGRHRPQVDLDQPRRPDLDAGLHRRAAPAARRPDQRGPAHRDGLHRRRSRRTAGAGRAPPWFSCPPTGQLAAARRRRSLPAAACRALDIRSAAVYRNQILIAGDVALTGQARPARPARPGQRRLAER